MGHNPLPIAGSVLTVIPGLTRDPVSLVCSLVPDLTRDLVPATIPCKSFHRLFHSISGAREAELPGSPCLPTRFDSAAPYSLGANAAL